MRLRKPCEHGRYDGHYYDEPDVSISLRSNLPCPGGEFLADDAAVLIRKHDEHGYPYIQEAEPREWGEADYSGWYIRVAPPSLSYWDALIVREGEG